MLPLYQLVGSYRALESLEPSEDIPLQVLQDTLDGLSGDIEVKATNVARYVLNIESMADAIERAATQMTERANRIRKKADAIRSYLKNNMEGVGRLKIETPEFVLCIKKNKPSVVIEDDTKVPDAFKKDPKPLCATPDKTLIAKALKNGMTIEGCRSEQATRLEIEV